MANDNEYKDGHGHESMPAFLTKAAFLAPHPPPTSRSNTPGVWPSFLNGQAAKPVRVLLVSDDTSLRSRIAHELLADLRIDLLGQGGSVKEGRELIKQHDLDVMLVDLNPSLNLASGPDLALIQHLKRVRPRAEAIVISALEDEQHALEAFGLGAAGYLVKHSWFGNFAQEVLQVVNGGVAITPSLARRLLGKLEPAVKSSRAMRRSETKKMLSAREQEVLALIAAGNTSEAMSEHLQISEKTVNTHLKNLFRKLGVRTRAQAVGVAARQGLL